MSRYFLFIPRWGTGEGSEVQIGKSRGRRRINICPRIHPAAAADIYEYAPKFTFRKYSYTSHVSTARSVNREERICMSDLFSNSLYKKIKKKVKNKVLPNHYTWTLNVHLPYLEDRVESSPLINKPPKNLSYHDNEPRFNFIGLFMGRQSNSRMLSDHIISYQDPNQNLTHHLLLWYISFNLSIYK